MEKFKLYKYRVKGVKGPELVREREFEILKVYPDKVNMKKDLFLCEETTHKYKECFHRMDLEGLTNDKLES